MPTPRNPNPLSLLDFIIYPAVILLGCWSLTVLGNVLGGLVTVFGE